MIEMKIKGVAVDPATSMPVVILKDQEGKRTLPIYVSEEVLEGVSGIDGLEGKEETEKLRGFLANLKPEDFGRYRM